MISPKSFYLILCIMPLMFYASLKSLS